MDLQAETIENKFRTASLQMEVSPCPLEAEALHEQG